MTIEEFQSLESPLQHWTAVQKSLWYDLKGNWKTAHGLIDQFGGTDAAHVHAYLHRKEGDQWNAEYWYRRAKQNVYRGNLDDEWKELFKCYVV
ncbi:MULTISPECIES: hypothetical protein [Sphingobacterium]|uniref:hypothetical protein n=1 Tax=Sphingobacterium TaxID=28453 RepID=UPI002580E54D|nr:MULTISPECIES: hypothetical protein [Sphingobacterium]